MQGAYNSGKHGKLGELLNYGDLRENSGNLEYIPGILVYQKLFFRYTICNIQQADVSLCGFSCTYVTMLFKNIFCNSARKVLKWLLRWFITSGFHFIIVWQRLFRGSGKPWKIREFHFSKFVSTLKCIFNADGSENGLPWSVDRPVPSRAIHRLLAGISRLFQGLWPPTDQ